MKLINFGLFQLGWFIAIWGAAHQTLLVSMIAIGLILMIHIIQARHKKEAAILLLMIMLLGPIFDQCLLSLGLIEYKSQFSEYICAYLDCCFVGIVCQHLKHIFKLVKAL